MRRRVGKSMELYKHTVAYFMRRLSGLLKTCR
jgi:hypothetical protein